jgi:hypothetical protein
MPFSISLSPPVAALRSDTGMTGFAKSHEVLRVTAAAFGKRENVMYLFGRRQLSLPLTFLAKRVSLDVTVTDSFPATAVPFI